MVLFVFTSQEGPSSTWNKLTSTDREKFPQVTSNEKDYTF